MRAPTADVARGRSAARRWAALLTLSVAFHATVLGAFALRLPGLVPYAEPQSMDVALVAPRLVTPVVSPSAPQPKPVETRLVMLPTGPRYAAPAEAPTGEVGDVVDMFGPVFADGLWPRPVLVRSEPCDPQDESDRLAACRRDLMLIGLASDAAPGAKAQP